MTTVYPELNSIVMCFRTAGIKRATIELDLDDIDVAVPKRQADLAMRLMKMLLPKYGCFVVTHLPWWKCRFKRYQTRTTWGD